MVVHFTTFSFFKWCNCILKRVPLEDFWAKLFPYAAYNAAATATSVQHKTEEKKSLYAGGGMLKSFELFSPTELNNFVKHYSS